MNFFIITVFLSLNGFSLSIDGTYREVVHVYVNYQNQKIINYFLVVGLEKNKIKFSEVSDSSILGFQEYLKIKKNESGTILLKTSEICLQYLSEGTSQNLFDSEHGICRSSSVIESLGKTSFIFWLKKLYFTYRDFVDWL